MTQRIEITDTRNQELLTMEFPQRLMAGFAPILATWTASLRFFNIRFNPPLHLPPSKKVIILAAIGAAIEEVET